MLFVDDDITGMDNIADGNFESSAAGNIGLQAYQLQAWNSPLYPAQSQLIIAKLTNLVNWKLARNSYFLKIIFFRESLKMFLNGKKCTHIIFSKKCKELTTNFEHDSPGAFISLLQKHTTYYNSKCLLIMAML